MKTINQLFDELIKTLTYLKFQMKDKKTINDANAERIATLCLLSNAGNPGGYGGYTLADKNTINNYSIHPLMTYWFLDASLGTIYVNGRTSSNDDTLAEAKEALTANICSYVLIL